MGALVVPKRMACNGRNSIITARIGVRLDGRDMGMSVKAYDVEKGTVETVNGEYYRGKVEPYWR